VHPVHLFVLNLEAVICQMGELILWVVHVERLAGGTDVAFVVEVKIQVRMSKRPHSNIELPILEQ